MVDDALQVEALKLLFSRYRLVIIDNKEAINEYFKKCASVGIIVPEECSHERLMRLSDEAYINTEAYPFDKMHRWLAFIQTSLSMMGLISIQEERDFTRPILHSYHSHKPPSF
jgi:hypothetical protein